MIRAMKKVKYVIKATKFKDNTYEDVVLKISHSVKNKKHSVT